MASSVPTLASYLSRITSEHANKPNFVAYVTALIQPFIDSQAALRSLLQIYDLDTAVGVQLDAVGQWIGRTRFVQQPIANLYFSFDTLGLGWDQGVWKGPFDPSDGLTRLDDDTYRALLKAKVILNSWDGSITEAAQALSLLLNNPSSIVAIQDNQDMSMTVGISGVVPSPLITALLNGGYLPINPEGVLVNYQLTSVNGTPLFGFDVANSAVNGWDRGAWEGALGAGPGLVQGLGVVSFTSTSVTLSWLAPSVGVGPYTYQLQYVVGDGTTGIWQTYGAPTSGTVATVSGLSPGTQYAFAVYAVNPSGPGPVSAPVVQITAGGVSGGVSAFGRATFGTLFASGSAIQAAYTASGLATILRLSASGGIGTRLARGLASLMTLSSTGGGSLTVAPAVTINPVTGATHTSATSISGTLQGFTGAPSMQYALDPVLPAVSGVTTSATSSTVSLAWAADAPITLSPLPSGAVISQGAFSFTLPAMSAGSHTLYLVANGSVVSHLTFTVS